MRTYASLAAEAGIDPAWTAAQIGHRDARYTLNVYTDACHRRENPAVRIGALVGLGTNAHSNVTNLDEKRASRESDPSLQSVESNISGG